MTIAELLNPCARLEMHGKQHHVLRSVCMEFRQWDALLLFAEEQGMAPLLYRHLVAADAEVPAVFLTGLRFLCMRHQKANAIRMESLRQVLLLLEEEGVPSLLLKGAALCQTLYPDSGLRPMRDIDLFLDPQDVQHIHKLLQQHGFRPCGGRLPKHYFHQAPLIQVRDGMEVCLELHHGLFPQEPPYYQELPFMDLYGRAQSFSMQGLQASYLSNEDMLWHLFQHGFHAPLTYEPYKLISVADIITLVESRVQEIDWDKITRVYPQLLRSLPLFHYLSSWQDMALRKFPVLPKVAPSAVGETYGGWPDSRACCANTESSFLRTLRATLFPGEWWQMLYYSTGNGRMARLYCHLMRHPMHILRWLKARCKAAIAGKQELDGA